MGGGEEATSTSEEGRGREDEGYSQSANSDIRCDGRCDGRRAKRYEQTPVSVMIELRRMDGKTWVALEDGLCVVPVALVDEFVRDWKEWRREFAVAVEI